MTRPAWHDRAAVRHAVAEWILPPAVKRVLLTSMSRARRDVSPAERAVLAANARLHGAYAGRRCFVLANGPSLANVDIEPLGEEITVVMNAFNRHPVMRQWQPVVHCAAEPASAYSGPHAVPLRFLRELVSGYESTTHVFPIEMKAIFDHTGILPPERLILVKQDGRRAAEFDNIDLTGPIPSAHDTSILAVSVAIAMGCDPIVLLGLDYNWLSHRSINAHFYDDDAVWWDAEDLSKSSYLKVMKDCVPCWEAHAALRRIAANSGQTILNATEGSFLDAYPCTTLGEVLAGRG